MATRTTWRRSIFISALAVMALGAAILITLLVRPSAPTEVYGLVHQHFTDREVEQVIEAGGNPTVTLGGAGGQAELDVCDGTFIEMTQYDPGGELDLPPTYSAHNGCGGDIILHLAVGTEVTVIDTAGQGTDYVITEELTTRQFATATSDLTGLDGDLLLQSCFWDNTTMRFISLEATE